MFEAEEEPAPSTIQRVCGQPGNGFLRRMSHSGSNQLSGTAVNCCVACLCFLKDARPPLLALAERGVL